ncbi:hypothetical protein COLO4_19301 [Corchorus olitorius]|uniref:Uncharacterized protein n=1 Tax=Corchorus olitorius TaxID=93759 RepID=A0A1R3J5X0_9ROSI|nr:hypothetical protein COLO4_19301 [Corchorus olitorius]
MELNDRLHKVRFGLANGEAVNIDSTSRRAVASKTPI